MAETIIQQGRFTSDGTAKTLQIRSDVDWMRVLNWTIAAADQTTAIGTEYYWQRGMTDDTGIVYKKSNAANAANLIDDLTSSGFTLVDSSVMTLGALNSTITNVQTGAPSTVLLTDTTGLVDGDVVRIINVTGAQQLGGVDFVVDNLVANTSFDLQWTASIVAGTTGYLRKVVNWNPLFYPRRRVVLQISQAAAGVVTLNVPHGYTAGQKVRFFVPDEFGMSELHNQTATITAVSTANNTITIDVDTSGYTAFAWPLTADVPFTHAQVIPLGEAAEESYVNLLDDATLNSGYIGMTLAGGAGAPGGANTNVMYWRAGKSTLVDNE